jgi:hypothetical protein
MRAERRTGSGREPDWAHAAARTRREARHPHEVGPAPARGLVAVFPTAEEAERAASAVTAAIPYARVQVGGNRAHVASLRAEMADEEARAVAGPAIGLYTKEMARGAVWGATIWSLLTAILALPFALIPFGGLTIGPRLLIVAIVGGVAGATFGFVAGGGAGAKGPAAPMAAETGVPLYVGVAGGDDSERAARTLSAAGPIRIDEFHDALPDRTIDLEQGGEDQPP